jgi:HEAT repeat protein
LVAKDSLSGPALIGRAESKGIRSIKLMPFDISKFNFVEDRLREEGSDCALWESYVSALIDGKLADSDAEGIVLSVRPEDIASVLNDRMSGDTDETTYDRVITSYLKKREHAGIRTESFNKFLSLIDNLSPELKQQFIKRAFGRPVVEAGEAESLLKDITSYDMERLEALLHENSSLIPESLSNLLDKLRHAKVDESFLDRLPANPGAVDDIEIDENIIRLFQDDQFNNYVNKNYQEELRRMMRTSKNSTADLAEEIEEQYREELIDKTFSEIVLELLGRDCVEREDYQCLLNRIVTMTRRFLEAGRFCEISEIYNTIYLHSHSGKFKDDASGMLANFFHSEEFLSEVIEALKLWGRIDREGGRKLAEMNKRHLMGRLLDALSEETDSSVRKFLLYVLSSFGDEIFPEVIRRLEDPRWYVVRNMMYLMREAGGIKYVRHVRRFARDKNEKICFEALKTLMHFKTNDSLSYIKFHLNGDDPELRSRVIRLTGTYRCEGAVPYLVQLLEEKDMFGSKSDDKVSLIRALGKIGDPRALSVLAKIYHSRAILFKADLDELRVEIFRSIENYPRDSVNHLLEIGLRSKNHEIRTISERLLVERGTADVSGNSL